MIELMDRHIIDGKQVFMNYHSCNEQINDDEEEKSLLEGLSSKDALFFDLLPDASLYGAARSRVAFDWISIMDLVDFSKFDRVLLTSEEVAQEFLCYMQDKHDPTTMPHLIYSSSPKYEGEISRDFLERVENNWQPANPNEKEMLSIFKTALSSSCIRLAETYQELSRGYASSVHSLTSSEASRIVKVLSNDILTISPTMFSFYFVFLEHPYVNKMLEKANEFGEEFMTIATKKYEVDMLCDIIDNMIENDIIVLSTPSKEMHRTRFITRNDDEILSCLDKNGINSYLDAALSGVPVEDLFA